MSNESINDPRIKNLIDMMMTKLTLPMRVVQVEACSLSSRINSELHGYHFDVNVVVTQPTFDHIKAREHRLSRGPVYSEPIPGTGLYRVWIRFIATLGDIDLAFRETDSEMYGDDMPGMVIGE